MDKLQQFLTVVGAIALVILGGAVVFCVVDYLMKRQAGQPQIDNGIQTTFAGANSLAI
jgi:hypothetical protein